MKNLSYQFALILLVGCAQAIEVDPDSADFVRYGFGGGELGSDWTEITIRGDGEVTYRLVQPYEGEWPQKETEGETLLSANETRKFFQGVLDAGLLSLQGRKRDGVDTPVTNVEAMIDGREIKESMEGIYDEGPHRVIKELIAEISGGYEEVKVRPLSRAAENGDRGAT